MISGWSPCVSGVAYSIGIDWDQDGDFTGSDDLTEDVLDRGIVSTYGRDQNRQLSPPKIGQAAFSVCNVSRIFSPENILSPIVTGLGPARPTQIQAEFQGTVFPIHSGRVDDFDVRADWSDRSVSFTSLDGLALLQNAHLSTQVYEGRRTGFLINVILDLIGWEAPRDLDVGANRPPWWWEEGTDAFSAVRSLVLSEGPPAIAYVAPDGTFVFRDRHHRIQDERSLVSQAFFNANEITCESQPVTGFAYTAPFVYQHGWRDIINQVTVDVNQRTPNPDLSVVWEDSGTYSLTTGEVLSFDAVANNPFIRAIPPDPDVDFNSISGVGSLNVTLSRTSGQSTTIRVRAVGGGVTFSGIRLRAQSLESTGTTKIEEIDSGSVSLNGEKAYPENLTWVNANNAQAVAMIILAHYAERRPIVEMRVPSCDPEHFVQVVTRTISDRITIRNGELGLFDDFHIESVSHDIRRINTDRGPVHSVTLGCERTVRTIENCFTFDVEGRGFDEGVFCGGGIDDPETVFIFDHPIQGQFDFGVFGT